MKKIIEILKDNLGTVKTIAIGILIVFLVSLAILNWFQDKWNQDLKSQTDILTNQKTTLQETIKGLHLSQKEAQFRIDSLEHKLDSLQKLYRLRGAEMELEAEKYEREIERIKSIPADTIYMDLQRIYPDPGSVKIYPFSGIQIRGIYKSHVKLEYNLDVNMQLMEQVSNLESFTDYKNEVIKNKNIQLGALKTELTTSRTYTSTLESQNEVYKKSYKSERLAKNIFQGIAGAEFLLILYQGFVK